ncbi:hypothetical protein AQS8620_00503 [Aquimixticola soesokkakensis]|uniref:Lipid A deacylase LpxR family protein n=2 Tax=Aquimixticola soesokkakensis TaxID=1519096 RepID=A0A1Y5RL81_9RHOB|nr:hypothetical protein AQS8620_00503 [Aquimixticola soesokkakensis]
MRIPQALFALSFVFGLGAQALVAQEAGGASRTSASTGNAGIAMGDSAVEPDAYRQRRFHLGFGRLFSNDRLGDGKDRWRTGSYVISNVRGYDWDGELPDSFGSLVEYRSRSEIIAPSNVSNPDEGARRHAGVLSFGAHTMWQYEGVELALGADAVFVGPQTGLGKFQKWIHERTDNPLPDLSDQIEDAFYPTLTFEAGKTFSYGLLDVRPFAQTMIGSETLVRFGGDILLGWVGHKDVWLRDVTTGIRYAATREEEMGGSIFIGADVAKVASSKFLPGDEGYELSDLRKRLRAGYRVQGDKLGIFYGMTYLSPEFEGQSEGQVTGSVQFKLRF